MLLEIQPVNPRVTAREFVHVDQVKRFWRELDGTWNGLLVDGTPVAFVDSDNLDDGIVGA